MGRWERQQAALCTYPRVAAFCAGLAVFMFLVTLDDGWSDAAILSGVFSMLFTPIALLFAWHLKCQVGDD